MAAPSLGLITRLFAACGTGDLETVRFLLSFHDDLVNYRGPHGWYPLHSAVATNNLGIVKFLLERGASLDQRTNDGRTPLMVAAGERGTNFTVEFLVDRSQDVNQQDLGGWTALHIAVENGNLDNTRTLLKGGADPNIPNFYTYTPTHIACEQNNSEMVKLLLEYSANLKLRDERGKHPLDLMKNLDVKRSVLVSYSIDQEEDEYDFEDTPQARTYKYL
eukprot:TRINITY_DN3268_c0_g2_i3.p1 TRINITY_DN3268_c0_g2~~TRINITY_DN3268_c0_g2_i3.p1  ORF type:complete len:243 (+),score=41.53 TRINITY_DN3268_c0_g2_i3:75-731(+)